MRIIPTRVHAVFDYAAAALLVISPWLFDFTRGGAATWLPVLAGIVAAAYSLGTDYELGAVRSIPMPIHLLLDMSVGLLLAVSPWLLGFAEYVWAPHMIIGLGTIGLALTTWRTPAVTKAGVPADASFY